MERNLDERAVPPEDPDEADRHGRALERPAKIGAPDVGRWSLGLALTSPNDEALVGITPRFAGERMQDRNGIVDLPTHFEERSD